MNSKSIVYQKTYKHTMAPNEYIFLAWNKNPDQIKRATIHFFFLMKQFEWSDNISRLHPLLKRTFQWKKKKVEKICKNEVIIIFRQNYMEGAFFFFFSWGGE